MQQDVFAILAILLLTKTNCLSICLCFYDHIITSFFLTLALLLMPITCFSFNQYCFSLQVLYGFCLGFCLFLLYVSCMLGWVSFILTFLKFPLINASDCRTVSILCQPPLTSITIKETCVSTMSPTQNTCGLHHSYLWIIYQYCGFLFHCG